MTKQQLFSAPLLLTILCSGCTEPSDAVVPPTDEGPPADDDEVGELPPPEDPSEPEPLPSGVCVTKEEPPYVGIRHQCGGSMDLAITGSAFGFPVAEDLFIEFGAQVSGDSYEHPRVAACCAEYDYEQLASDQPEYWRTCLYDAVQQFCAALPYYVWDIAENAEDMDKLIIAEELTKLGNDLATAAEQYECLETLWAGGPGQDDFNAVLDRSWNPAYDVWVNIDILEVYDIWLPEDPGNWLTCKSIYENDGTVMPDISPGPVWDNFKLDAGSLKLSGLEFELDAVADASSELLLGRNALGKPVLGALQLHGGVMRVAGFTFERWRLASLREAVASEREDGSLAIPAGALAFVGAVVVDGDVINVPASNASELILRPSNAGWTIDPFNLVYTQATGDVWTLESSVLDFAPR